MVCIFYQDSRRLFIRKPADAPSLAILQKQNPKFVKAFCISDLNT
jgi:hypothetical protein